MSVRMTLGSGSRRYTNCPNKLQSLQLQWVGTYRWCRHVGAVAKFTFRQCPDFWTAQDVWFPLDPHPKTQTVILPMPFSARLSPLDTKVLLLLRIVFAKGSLVLWLQDRMWILSHGIMLFKTLPPSEPIAPKCTNCSVRLQ